LPNQCYDALPILCGAVKDAGHEAFAVDLNLASADMLLTDQRAERYLRVAHDRAAKEPGLWPMVRTMEPKVRAGERSKDVLRDRVRCYDQGLFREAFWTVVDALHFYYQLDPIISPFRKTFARDVSEHAGADPWSPMRDLYDEGLLDEVLGRRPDAVGICCAFPEQAAETFRLARKLRQRRADLPLFLGGPLLDAETPRWLEAGWIFEFFDALMVGDGVAGIQELLAALEGRHAMEHVTNLAWRDRNGDVRRNDPRPKLDDLDEIPLPDFRDIDMARFLTPLPIYPLMVSRGCWWGKCTFCSIGWIKDYRMASGERIQELATDLVRSYGARYVQVQDSSIPPRGARMLADAIAQEGLDLYWSGEMKFERHFLEREYCDALYRGGCRSLLMGFESSSQSVLDLMQKGYRHDELPTMLANLREAGISAELSWFIGFPTDTKQSVLATVRWLYDNRDLFGLTACVGDYQLHPDTAVFSDPASYGVTVIDQDNGYCRYVLVKGINQQDLAQLKPLLGINNNRTLVCNSAHLPHLVESGLDLSGLERPMTVPNELVLLCEQP
jgi:hypothetical protein